MKKLIFTALLLVAVVALFYFEGEAIQSRLIDVKENVAVIFFNNDEASAETAGVLPTASPARAGEEAAGDDDADGTLKRYWRIIRHSVPELFGN